MPRITALCNAKSTFVIAWLRDKTLTSLNKLILIVILLYLALPCPALPCPALPCPALPFTHLRRRCTHICVHTHISSQKAHIFGLYQLLIFIVVYRALPAFGGGDFLFPISRVLVTRTAACVLQVFLSLNFPVIKLLYSV